MVLKNNLEKGEGGETVGRAAALWWAALIRAAHFLSPRLCQEATRRGTSIFDRSMGATGTEKKSTKSGLKIQQKPSSRRGKRLQGGWEKAEPRLEGRRGGRSGRPRGGGRLVPCRRSCAIVGCGWLVGPALGAADARRRSSECPSGLGRHAERGVDPLRVHHLLSVDSATAHRRLRSASDRRQRRLLFVAVAVWSPLVSASRCTLARRLDRLASVRAQFIKILLVFDPPAGNALFQHVNRGEEGRSDLESVRRRRHGIERGGDTG